MLLLYDCCGYLACGSMLGVAEWHLKGWRSLGWLGVLLPSECQAAGWQQGLH